MSEFWKAANSYIPITRPEIEYRLYYEGEELLYTTKEPAVDTDKTFIVITETQFENYRPGYGMIKDGKLLQRKKISRNLKQLERVEAGDYRTVKDNMVFVNYTGDEYSEIKSYD
jgi:hypothetical protein